MLDKMLRLAWKVKFKIYVYEILDLEHGLSSTENSLEVLPGLQDCNRFTKMVNGCEFVYGWSTRSLLYLDSSPGNKCQCH